MNRIVKNTLITLGVALIFFMTLPIWLPIFLLVIGYIIALFIFCMCIVALAAYLGRKHGN